MRTTTPLLIALLMSAGGCSPKHDEPEARSSESAHSRSSQPATTAPPTDGLDWRSLERPLLTNHVQITSRDRFYKAGEAYFDHHTPPSWVVFQAVAVAPKGADPDPFYAMYVAKLTRDASGHITATEEPVKISPDGSANTCGWFHPTEPGTLLFGSTMRRPANNEKSGFQVGTRKYVWMFPAEMEVVRLSGESLRAAMGGSASPRTQPALHGPSVFLAMGDQRFGAVFTRANYDAECSYSKDGRFILYAHVRDEPTRGRPDADIWIYDTQTRQHHEIVHGDGYDGGPFFSPDNTMICYRSDRRGDDLLQLFVAKLKFDESGVPVGIVSEHQVTDDEHVNWAPYWHPSGRFLVYGSSGVGHSNYEIFAVEADTTKAASQLRKRRVTFSTGADVLPVFSDDGRLMMWTAQRGPTIGDETRPSSQLWIAEVHPGAGGFSDPAHLFDNLPDQRPEGPAPAVPPSHP